VIFSEQITCLLDEKPLAYIATADNIKKPNISLKGIIDYNKDKGIIYFLDLFSKKTRTNLKINKQISIAVVNEKSVSAFQFKGTTEMINNGPLFEKYAENWDEKQTDAFREEINWNFLTSFSNAAKEILLPAPKYLVKVTVTEIINLAPF
jgi:predicted pyridoxine 5'-phosphate oxidase superfamily flavin-nucleotide-binding protein